MGLFLFIFCLVLLFRQARLRPDCPRWLKPIPEEKRMQVQPLPKWAENLLPLGLVVGLMLHFMT